MKTEWAKNWNLTTAVIRLALGPARYESVDNHESCLPNVIKDGFEGRFGRLQQREDMKSLVAVLPQVVDSLRRKMVSIGLEKNAELPPVVWLRLMHEEGLKPVDVAAREFEHWQEQMRANGMTILYRRFDDVKKKFVGPTRERDGLGEVPGYSVNEMLTEQNKPRHWPYCYRWTCVCKASKGTGGLPTAKMEEPISDANIPVPLATRKRRAATTPPKQRRMRSRKALERACGARLITSFAYSGDRDQ